MKKVFRIQADSDGSMVDTWIKDRYVSIDYGVLGDLSRYFDTEEDAEKIMVNKLKIKEKCSDNIAKKVSKRMTLFYRAVIDEDYVLIADKWRIYAIAKFTGEYTRLEHSTKNDNFKNRAPIKLIKKFGEPVCPDGVRENWSNGDPIFELVPEDNKELISFLNGLFVKPDYASLKDKLTEIIDLL